MTEPTISPISPTQPTKPSNPTPPLNPSTSVPALQPTAEIKQPVITPTRALRNDNPVSSRNLRPIAPNRSGTFVTGMVLNLDSNRIAFVTPQGIPIRGDVNTDVFLGCYSLKPDRPRQLWVFDPNQVRSGLRFSVELNGTRPFDLQYSETLLLSVVSGLQDTRLNSLQSVQKAIADAVADQEPSRYLDAFELLNNLNDVDLYDVLDELDGTGVIGELLLNFETVLKAQPEGMSRLLRALESYEWKPEKLYIDAFDKCYVDPESFSRDKEREKAGLTNIRLVFTYDLKPPRAIIIFADDISDSDRKPAESPRYGEGQLLYPQWVSKGSTPRIWDAKKKKIAEIESQNLEFFITAYQAVQDTINLVMMANGLLTRTIPAAMGTVAPVRGLSRPISEAYARQPGRWELDFQGGTNMSEKAAEYEARVCNKDAGIHYKVNGVEFDGYDHSRKTLLESKHFLDNGGRAKFLANPQIDGFRAANKLLDQGVRQARAARGMSIEWRVAGKVAAGRLEELFRVNNVPIRVVYFP